MFMMSHMTSLFTVDLTILMTISKEDKILIESLFETKGCGTRRLLKQFPQRKSGQKVVYTV